MSTPPADRLASTLADLADSVRPSRRDIVLLAIILNTELLAMVTYLLLTDVTLSAPRYALYGLVWLTLGLWVLVKVRPAPASTSTRRKALAVAAGYFVLLAVAGGLVTGGGMGALGARISWLPPGWGPALIYSGATVNVILMPARVVGYFALAYLVYATVIDAASAAVSGLLGLLSCVSCSWPILASLAAAVAGGGSALAAATTPLSYDLSTLVFVVTVGLLYWRPFGRSE
jgi:hypothetical protein